MTELVSIPEYARRLGLNASTIHRQVASGAIPSVEGADGRRKIDFAAGAAALQAQFAGARALPEMHRFGRWRRPRPLSFGHCLISPPG